MLTFSRKQGCSPIDEMHSDLSDITVTRSFCMILGKMRCADVQQNQPP